MRGDARTWLGRVAALALGGAAIAAIAVWLNASARSGEGPQPIAWGHEPCSECRMLIADRRFATQLRTADGRAHSFDDPGCSLRWLERKAVQAREIYFHHAREERWLRAPAVGFVDVPGSPMGYDLGAVDPSEPGAITLAAAKAKVADHIPTSAREPR